MSRTEASRRARADSSAGCSAISRAVEAHLGSRDVARVIYGAIIGLAIVVALQEHPPTAGQVAAALVGSAVAVGLAARLAGSRPGVALLHAAAVGAIGGMLIALKAVLH